MKRAALSFAGAALIVTLAFLTLAQFEARSTVDRFREDAALLIARSVAHVAAHGEDLQSFVGALPKDAVVETFVLKSTKYEAHSDPERAGTRLNPESLEDKALFDSANRLKTTVQKNAELRAGTSSISGNPYPELEVSMLPDGRATAIVPVLGEAGFRGVALATVNIDPPAPRFTWSIVLFACFALLAFLLASRVPKGRIWIGALLLLGLVVMDWNRLIAWRDAHRRAEVATLASLQLAVAAAGGLKGLPLDGPGALATSLAMGRDGQPAGDVLVVRSATIGAAAIPGLRFSEEPYEVIWSETWLSTQNDSYAAKLRRWSFGIALIALLFWVLGASGKLSAARRSVLQHGQAFRYLSPAMLGMLVLVFIPVVFGIVLGFFERAYNIYNFIGLANYGEILASFNLADPQNFYFKLGVTVFWTSSNVALHVSIGLFLALLLNDEMLKAKGIYRVLLIIPWALPNYITALIWKGMFHKQFGAINFLIEGFGFEPISWFQTFWPAFFANLATNTWLGFPFMMVVSLGALQSIPGDLYEAAYVDGASRWQRFRNITLPLLKPVLIPAVIVGSIWTFNMFNIIYLVSGGEPNGATDILVTDAYRWAFERDRYGYAAAYSTLIFVILLLFTLVTNKVTGATKGVAE